MSTLDNLYYKLYDIEMKETFVLFGKTDRTNWSSNKILERFRSCYHCTNHYRGTGEVLRG